MPARLMEFTRYSLTQWIPNLMELSKTPNEQNSTKQM